MHQFSDRPSRRRIALPTACLSVLGLTAVLVPPSAGAAQAAQPDRLTVATFDRGTPDWNASSNSRLREVVMTGRGDVGHLRPKKSSGRKTIRMTSPSSEQITAAGTVVRAVVGISTEHRGPVTLRIFEINRGKVVNQTSTTINPSSTTWRSVSTTLRTRRAASRIRISTIASRVASKRFLRVGAINLSMTPPATATTTPTPTSSTPTATPPTPPPTTGACEDIDYSDPGQGRLTFAEEFDGSEIDRTKWRVRDNTYLSFDQAQIRKENVTVHDGSLDIMGKKLPRSEWQMTDGSRYTWNKTRDYSTGYVDTIDDAGYGNAVGDRFGQKYGHFEVRALVPSSNTMSRGIWPAFWLRADHRLGEIDPMESYGGPTTRNYDPSSSFYWNSWADTSQQSTYEHTMGRAHADEKHEPIWKNWHTYGVNWSPTCLRYTYDGRTVGIVPLSSKPYFTGYSFDDTFHIRLNMQIGSNYWGQADDTHTRPEFHYLVDWVRVYQGLHN